jgi:amidohydrolase
MYEADIADSIARNSKQIRNVADFIYNTPEIGYKEFESSRKQVDFLKEFGFTVEYPFAGVETAFKASYGSGEATFCIISEYDALPGLGHACGHNLISAAALAAGIAVKEVMYNHSLPGQIVIMGTPAEESLGGKIRMIKQGAFNGVEGAIICHPYYVSGLDPGDLAVSRYKVDFFGKASHAAASPEKGINALDAVNLVFCAVNAWRQQLPEASRVHGIITSGGDAPNIIPEQSGVFFYLRAETNKIRSEMEQRFEDIIKGASLMTGANYKIDKQPNSYDANLPNSALNEMIRIQAEEIEMQFVEIKDRISTDFGNLTQIIPGANFFFKITRRDHQVPLHSQEFLEEAGNIHGFEQSMNAAAIMAATSLRFLSDREFRREVLDDFLKEKAKTQD